MALAVASALFAVNGASAQGDVSAETGYRKIRPPETYGSVVIDKNTRAAKTVAPAVFSHRSHRLKYTCSLCHTDLGFPMKAAVSDIKQADIEAGKSCGSCHNGKTAFGAFDCEKCHSYGSGVSEDPALTNAIKDLPKDDFGNKVNWVAALRQGKIKPSASLDGKKEMTVLDMDVVIPATKFTPHPPDVLFPHKAHTEQLECSSCHTAIFEMNKGGNPQMSMLKVIAGQYCGVCHGKVAFPLQDCFRCHSQPVPKMEEPATGGPKKDGKGSEEKK